MNDKESNKSDRISYARSVIANKNSTDEEKLLAHLVLKTEALETGDQEFIDDANDHAMQIDKINISMLTRLHLLRHLIFKTGEDKNSSVFKEADGYALDVQIDQKASASERILASFILEIGADRDFSTIPLVAVQARAILKRQDLAPVVRRIAKAILDLNSKDRPKGLSSSPVSSVAMTGNGNFEPIPPRESRLVKWDSRGNIPRKKERIQELRSDIKESEAKKRRYEEQKRSLWGKMRSKNQKRMIRKFRRINQNIEAINVILAKQKKELDDLKVKIKPKKQILDVNTSDFEITAFASSPVKDSKGMRPIIRRLLLGLRTMFKSPLAEKDQPMEVVEEAESVQTPDDDPTLISEEGQESEEAALVQVPGSGDQVLLNKIEMDTVIDQIFSEFLLGPRAESPIGDALKHIIALWPDIHPEDMKVENLDHHTFIELMQIRGATSSESILIDEILKRLHELIKNLKPEGMAEHFLGILIDEFALANNMQAIDFLRKNIKSRLRSKGSVSGRQQKILNDRLAELGFDKPKEAAGRLDYLLSEAKSTASSPMARGDGKNSVSSSSIPIKNWKIGSRVMELDSPGRKGKIQKFTTANINKKSVGVIVVIFDDGQIRQFKIDEAEQYLIYLQAKKSNKANYPTKVAVEKKLEWRDKAGLDNYASALNKNIKENGDSALYNAARDHGVDLPKKIKFPDKAAVEKELERRDEAGLDNHALALNKNKKEGGNRRLYIMALEHGVDLPRKSSSPIMNENQVGGIDLNSAHLNLQIKRDDNGVPLPLNLQPIETMQIDGFVPIIINITPVMSMPLLSSVVNEHPTRKTSNDEEYRPSPMAYLGEKLNIRKNTLASRLDENHPNLN